MKLTSQLTRFGFKIRARNGATVEKLLILGRTVEDANNKLEQMYPCCEILSTWKETEPGKPGSFISHNVPKACFEEIADLIIKN
jgi:hypothetical protein